MIPFFGKSMYDDPDAYWAVSAIRTIKQAHTPTFIYVGERDIEVPPTQSIEYWHALQAMNVPTSLVIYPDEGHGIRAAGACARCAPADGRLVRPVSRARQSPHADAAAASR